MCTHKKYYWFQLRKLFTPKIKFLCPIKNFPLFEGFVCRFILLSKLNCLPEQKRSFLTWFAGSLHLYADEFLLKSEEECFKHVLAKLFEGLILNGLLNNSEFKNFYRMLIRRNEEMITALNNSYYSNQALSGNGEADEQVRDGKSLFNHDLISH